VRVFVDCDWAGCLRLRRSTSGGIARLGDHALRTWPTTQPIVALSSAEAEFHAMFEGAIRGNGLRSALEEMGVVTDNVELHTGSSAAKSFASRHGVGRLRHIDLKELWSQEAAKVERVRLRKVAGEGNPAGILTKHLDLKRIR
jgi:hypothetical protein